MKRMLIAVLLALNSFAPAQAQTPAQLAATIAAKADTIDRKCGAWCSGTINRLAREIKAILAGAGAGALPPVSPPAVPPPPPVVTPPPPPPPPPVVPPPADGALLSETFAGMRSVADIQAAKWYGKSDYFSAARIGIDTTDGAPGGSGRSMVYQFPAGSGGVGVLMYRPSSTTEDWTEIWAKFSPNFASTGSCGGNNPDYKFVFWALQPGDARNEIKVGNYGEMRYLDTRYMAGPDVLRITASSPISSGRWHRYRVHNKVGASAVFTVEFWDGVNAPQRLAQTGFSLSYSSMNYLVLGANRNCTAASDQWLKWGSIRIYTSNPGWGF